jgi:DNA-binding NarL/FixJ family response regulator
LLLVDDHSLIRAGVRALVLDIPGYSVVGEANDGSQLVETVERLVPDIVLLDLSMKQTGGMEALQRLKRVRPQCKVLILSMHTDPALIMQALESGAHGYLLKDTTATELEQALEALRNNERYLSPAIAHTVINQALVRNRTNRRYPQPDGAPAGNPAPDRSRQIHPGNRQRPWAEHQDRGNPSLADHEALADLRRGRAGSVCRA